MVHLGHLLNLGLLNLGNSNNKHNSDIEAIEHDNRVASEGGPLVSRNLGHLLHLNLLNIGNSHNEENSDIEAIEHDVREGVERVGLLRRDGGGLPDPGLLNIDNSHNGNDKNDAAIEDDNSDGAESEGVLRRNRGGGLLDLGLLNIGNSHNEHNHNFGVVEDDDVYGGEGGLLGGLLRRNHGGGLLGLGLLNIGNSHNEHNHEYGVVEDDDVYGGEGGLLGGLLRRSHGGGLLDLGLLNIGNSHNEHNHNFGVVEDDDVYDGEGGLLGGLLRRSHGGGLLDLGLLNIGNSHNENNHNRIAVENDGRGRGGLLGLRDAEIVPSYASDLVRLHHTVLRARSVIQSRDTTIPIPESEVESVLGKIQELERQVEALLHHRVGVEAATAVPDNQEQQDCDAENLMFDLGARAEVDENAQVSGHPFFRRNANCIMESAVKGPADSNMGMLPPSAKWTDDEASASGAETADAPVWDSAGTAQTPNVPDEFNAEPKPVFKFAPASAPDSQQKNVVMGGAPDVAAAAPVMTPAADVPAIAYNKQVVSAVYTQEIVEVHTVGDEFVTSTITKTKTRQTTVHITPSASAAGNATKYSFPTPQPSDLETAIKEKALDGNLKKAFPLPDTFKKFSSVNTNTTTKALNGSSVYPVMTNLTNAASMTNITGHATDLHSSAAAPLSDTELDEAEEEEEDEDEDENADADVDVDVDAESKFVVPKIKFMTMHVLPVPSNINVTSTNSTSPSGVVAAASMTTSYSVPKNASAFVLHGQSGFKTLRRRLS
ncbi:hypothetical protein E4U21_005491 [Claviceps maximensis]|nr:hypothetical protein E4U21_005491 [Claviceps maximensis]